VAGSPFAAGTNPVSVTIDPSARFVYVGNGTSNNISMYTINTPTGALTSIGTVATGAGPSVTVDPSGRFAYSANLRSNNISMFSINSATGVLTQTTPATVSTGIGPRAVAVAGVIQ